MTPSIPIEWEWRVFFIAGEKTVFLIAQEYVISMITRYKIKMVHRENEKAVSKCEHNPVTIPSRPKGRLVHPKRLR
jgi:hypothetical protein